MGIKFVLASERPAFAMKENAKVEVKNMGKFISTSPDDHALKNGD